MKTSRISQDTERILGRLSASSRTKIPHDIGSSLGRRVTRSSSSSTWALSVANGPGSTGEGNSASRSTSVAKDGVGSEAQSQQQQPVRRLSARVKAFSYQANGTRDNGSIDGSDKASKSDTSISKKRKRRSIVNQEDTSTDVITAVKVKDEENALETSTNASASNSPSQVTRPPRKAKRQPAKRILGADRSILRVDPPARWQEMYALTEQMRRRILAPVDTMGCESLAEEKRTPRDKRFQTLVALMLSSQTKDTVNAVAMRNLQDNLPGGFNLESMLKVDGPVLNKLIEKVGFHNNKTRFIKAAAEMLRDSHDSDIPDTIDGLVALPGVGPKMAYLCMSAAWGRDEGIGVDVHVHRITNLWGWHATKTPEETRAMLEAWLPKEKWHQINHLLVGFGQTVCLPVGRKCWECDLAKEGLCPSAMPVGKMREMEKKKEKEEEKKKRKDKIEGGVMVKDEDRDEKAEVEVKAESAEVEVGKEARKDQTSLVGVDSRPPLDLEDVV